jgi:hypothetical protein
MSDLSLLSEVNRKSGFGVVRAAFDPKRKSSVSGHRASRTNKLDLRVRLRFPRWRRSNGSRERTPDDRLREEANPLRETGGLLSRINVIWPVQSCFQKDSAFRSPQIKSISPPFRPQRGDTRSSRPRGGMQWTLTMLLTRAPDADGEVVWS